MGYRSDVGIKCQRGAFERIMKTAQAHDFMPEIVLRDEKYDEYFLEWQYVKWYSGFYDEVDAIELELSDMDGRSEEDIEKEKLGYKMIRIGESDNDIETRTNDYDCELYLTMEFDTGRRMYEYRYDSNDSEEN